jgi:hypothetical protein
MAPTMPCDVRSSRADAVTGWALINAQHLGLKPVADWLEDVPARAWKRLSAKDGAKSPRFYDWASLRYRFDTARGW